MWASLPQPPSQGAYIRAIILEHFVGVGHDVHHILVQVHQLLLYSHPVLSLGLLELQVSVHPFARDAHQQHLRHLLGLPADGQSGRLEVVHNRLHLESDPRTVTGGTSHDIHPLQLCRHLVYSFP